MSKLLVANYKMNGDLKFYKSVVKNFNKIKVKDTKIVLCPPFVYLSNFKIKNKHILIGCQDIAEVNNKKSTGQISPSMLKDFGVKYAIVGHSERRAIGETDEMVSLKVKQAVENGIVPIICVGEQKKNSALEAVIQQVKIALTYVNGKDEVVITYEPVWAIGSGEVPTNARIKKVIKQIRETINELGLKAKCLYGGSVNELNYLEIIKTGVDGFLLGGVSRDLIKFGEIIRGVDCE